MTWFKKAKAERRKLESEIETAQNQLHRANKQAVRVTRLHDILKAEVDQNHMGDRLKEHFQQSRRRPGHGSANSV